MIVRHLKGLIGSERDGLGLTFHDTTIFAGTETCIRYKHHLEAVYGIEGEDELEDRSHGETIPLNPDTLYALTGHDNHYLRATANLRLIRAFNPPLVGNEAPSRGWQLSAAPRPQGGGEPSGRGRTCSEKTARGLRQTD